MKVSHLLMFLFAICLLIPTLAFAQGEFLVGKESGGGLQLSASMGSDDAFAGGAEFGYSVAGVFDFSAGAGVQSVNDESKGFVGLGSTLWLLKKGRNSNDFSFGIFGQAATTGKVKTLSGGGILPLQISVGKETMLVTSLGGGVTKIDTDYWWSDSFYFSAFDLSVVYPTGSKGRMAISANVVLAEEGNNSAGLSLTFLFGVKQIDRKER